MTKISVAIPYHGDRWPFVRRTLDNLAGDVRVAEVVLVDDMSSDADGTALLNGVSDYEAAGGKIPINVQWNDRKLFVFHNKCRAVRLTGAADWVCLLDSDNVIDRSYLDAWEKALAGMLYSSRLMTVFLPEFARPDFDYRKFSNRVYTRENVAGMMDRKMFDCLLNTCNFVVHRDTFLRAMGPQSEYEPRTADSMWINYRLLLAGCKLVVCPGMQYEHTVHEGSTWRLHHAGEGDEEAARIGKLLREMR